jgi:endonuclease/exonuclease/phosphatase family metal-dependent hydrolase
MIQRWPTFVLAVLVNTASGGTPFTATADDPTITVATYNILHHTDTFLDDVKSLVLGIPRPSERITPVLELLAGLDADIIALQEVTPALLSAINGNARLRAWQVASTQPPAAGLVSPVRHGRALPARHTAVGPGHPVSPATSTVHVHPMIRPLLVADITICVQTLRVSTCHLDSFAEHRQKRVWQLDQALRQLGSAQHAMLLGDFNFGDAAPENAAIASGFRDLWREAHADQPSNALRLSRQTGHVFRNRQHPSPRPDPAAQPATAGGRRHTVRHRARLAWRPAALPVGSLRRRRVPAPAPLIGAHTTGTLLSALKRPRVAVGHHRAGTRPVPHCRFAWLRNIDNRRHAHARPYRV